MSGPEFLNRKYPDLPGSRPVERAAQKVKREGGKAPYERAERTEAYLDRLGSIIQDKTGLANLKRMILEKYTTKPEDIPESYWKLQERIMRERGQAGDWERASEKEKAELKRQNSEGVLADQRSSLEQWVDEFASSDLDYVPKALKYWIFRNVLGLQEYDKEKKEFPKRSKGTVKQFPDINHDALLYVIDAIKEKYEGKGVEFEYDIQEKERQQFRQFLEKEDFAKLYAWANELYNPIPEHLLPVTAGEWRTYEHGSDPLELVKTVRGKGTGWCTAGEQTAKTQLQGGDFHVFYSIDDDKRPTIPRIAIRMEGEHIAEVRGVAYKQNLDPYMTEVLAGKLAGFPDGEKYMQKDADMKRLTEIELKTKTSEPLTKNELVFLYEIERPIQGFGYQRDPRIEELRSRRHAMEDAPVVFGCEPEEIAWNADEIDERTKADVGRLRPGIFDRLRTVEHIYTSFPEGKIERRSLEIGGKTKGELKKELERRGMQINSQGNFIIDSEDFTTLKNPERIDLVRLTVRDLGFPRGATTEEIYTRAAEFGLELCPPEVGPHYRLAYADQPLGDWTAIGMKQINDSDGYPNVFTAPGC